MYSILGASDFYYNLYFILSSSVGTTSMISPGCSPKTQTTIGTSYTSSTRPLPHCADSNNPWSYVWIGFKGIRVDTILKNCGFSKNCLTLPAPAPTEYMTCFDDLFEHRNAGFSDNLYRESILLKLFAILANHHAAHTHKDNHEQTGYSDNTYVNLAIDYINKTYMQGIGVSDIAGSIGISGAHLNHIFQQELNISIQNFLIDFRMHKAANLLVSTVIPIKEVSNRVGYNDQLVFSKAFITDIYIC